MKTRSLLMVNQHQFGHQTGPYVYCKYLRDTYEITYVCWDYGGKRVDLAEVRVEYVSRAGPKPVRLGRFLMRVFRELWSRKYTVLFVVYFQGCMLLRIVAPLTKAVLEVRTVSDRKDHPRIRRLENVLIRVECLFYRYVTVLSPNMVRALRLNETKSHIVPLGGEGPTGPSKTFEDVRLFYVGTLDQRDIHKTVQGLDLLFAETGGGVKVTYDIVGDGPLRDRTLLLDAIAKSPYRDHINFHGRLPYAEIVPFLHRANVGVAFIPLVEYYRCQPSTKVFEYLLAGMPVIATATDENRLVIHDGNGVLIDDTEAEFCRGVRTVVANRSHWNSGLIREKSLHYSWEMIVRENLSPYLQNVLDGKGRHHG